MTKKRKQFDDQYMLRDYLTPETTELAIVEHSVMKESQNSNSENPLFQLSAIIGSFINPIIQPELQYA